MRVKRSSTQTLPFDRRTGDAHIESTHIAGAAATPRDGVAHAAPSAWSAAFDVECGDARADVLFTREGARGPVRVALNFALGPACAAQALERHHALEAAGVRTAWFFDEHPGEAFDARTVVFTPTASQAAPGWTFAGVTLDPAGATCALLEGRFRWRSFLRLEGPVMLRLEPKRGVCDACGGDVVAVRATVLRTDAHGELYCEAACGDGVYAAHASAGAGKLVARVLATRPWPNEPVVRWKPARGGEAAGWDGRCPHCNAPASLGDDARRILAPDASADLRPATFEISAPAAVAPCGHWCFNKGASDGNHCPDAVDGPVAPARAAGAPKRVQSIVWVVRNRSSIWCDQTGLVGPSKPPEGDANWD